MVRRGDPVGDELKSIRRRFNERLYKAYKQGRLEDEVEQLEREGLKAYREADANGRKRNGRKPRAGR